MHRGHSRKVKTRRAESTLLVILSLVRDRDRVRVRDRDRVRVRAVEDQMGRIILEERPDGPNYTWAELYLLLTLY